MSGKRVRTSKRTLVRSFFVMLVLVGLAASLAYWRRIAPAPAAAAALRVTPTAVVAGAEAKFRVEGLAPDDHLMLRPLEPSAGDDVPLSFASPLHPLGFRDAMVAVMRAGQYAVLRNGKETGMTITAAEPYSPRPLGFFGFCN